MTYGQLKLRMTQLFPGVSLDILEGFIQDRYTEILGELDWSRLTVQSMLVTTAPYTTGTVAVTLGSNAVVGTGTTFTAAMSGRAFRVPGRDEFYEFTYLSATTGTLDRAYQGPSGALASFSIFQFVYPLPADCRLLHDEAFAGSWGPSRRFTHGQLNRHAWSYDIGGSGPWCAPGAWASYMDSGDTIPRIQVELYWVPTVAVGLPYTYIAEPANLSGTSDLLKVWLQPAALIEGVSARALRHLKDYTGSQMAAVAADKALQTMRGTEARGMAPAQMQLDSYYTAYRHKRNCR